MKHLSKSFTKSLMLLNFILLILIYLWRKTTLLSSLPIVKIGRFYFHKVQLVCFLYVFLSLLWNVIGQNNFAQDRVVLSWCVCMKQNISKSYNMILEAVQTCLWNNDWFVGSSKKLFANIFKFFVFCGLYLSDYPKLKA